MNILSKKEQDAVLAFLAIGQLAREQIAREERFAASRGVTRAALLASPVADHDQLNRDYRAWCEAIEPGGSL